MENKVVEEEVKVETEQFKVDTPEKADWAFSKLAEIKSEMKQINERTEQQLHRIEKWHSDEISKLDRDYQYFESLLKEFTDLNLQKNPKFKFSSPYGKIRVTHTKKWTYDDDLLIDEYKDTDVVKKVYKLNKTAFKKHVQFINGKVVDKDTGEVVKGANVSEQTNINVNVSEEA